MSGTRRCGWLGGLLVGQRRWVVLPGSSCLQRRWAAREAAREAVRSAARRVAGGRRRAGRRDLGRVELGCRGPGLGRAGPDILLGRRFGTGGSPLSTKLDLT